MDFSWLLSHGTAGVVTFAVLLFLGRVWLLIERLLTRYQLEAEYWRSIAEKERERNELLTQAAVRPALAAAQTGARVMQALQDMASDQQVTQQLQPVPSRAGTSPVVYGRRGGSTW